jgi:hypothetical protein
MADETPHDPLSGKGLDQQHPAVTRLTLPVEYLPQRQDAQGELAAPETSLFDFFKQSLKYTSNYCTDVDCCSFWHEHASAECQPATQEAIKATLKYPLALFADLTDLPAPAILHQLEQCFRARVIGAVPFISKVPSLAANRRSKHFDLLICKALFGSFVSSNVQHRDLMVRLWLAATRLVTATVSVDNSLGRAVGWLSAVCRPLRMSRCHFSINYST